MTRGERRVSVGEATVVGHVLQPAEQRRLVLWTRLLGLWLLLQGQAVLPAGTLPRADHAVDLPEALQGAMEDTNIRLCIIFNNGWKYNSIVL